MRTVRKSLCVSGYKAHEFRTNAHECARSAGNIRFVQISAEQVAENQSVEPVPHERTSIFPFLPARSFSFPPAALVSFLPPVPWRYFVISISINQNKFIMKNLFALIALAAFLPLCATTPPDPVASNPTDHVIKATVPLEGDVYVVSLTSVKHELNITISKDFTASQSYCMPVMKTVYFVPKKLGAEDTKRHIPWHFFQRKLC